MQSKKNQILFSIFSSVILINIEMPALWRSTATKLTSGLKLPSLPLRPSSQIPKRNIASFAWIGLTLASAYCACKVVNSPYIDRAKEAFEYSKDAWRQQPKINMAIDGWKKGWNNEELRKKLAYVLNKPARNDEADFKEF